MQKTKAKIDNLRMERTSGDGNGAHLRSAGPLHCSGNATGENLPETGISADFLISVPFAAAFLARRAGPPTPKRRGPAD
jgi:hypothetical protein